MKRIFNKTINSSKCLKSDDEDKHISINIDLKLKDNDKQENNINSTIIQVNQNSPLTICPKPSDSNVNNENKNRIDSMLKQLNVIQIKNLKLREEIDDIKQRLTEIYESDEQKI